VGIRIVHLSKKFGSLEAVKDVGLKITQGEFFTLLGPSGCGKTTLLRCIAGFNQTDQGEIFFATRRVDRLPAHKRGVGMVFQNYAIFPHLSVFDNVAYGLRARRVPGPEISLRVKRALGKVRLEGFEGRLPNQLSGGQLQRVAIARALVIEPQVLLMDEPLSNLDAKLRVEMRSEIRELQQAMKITTVYVTHDQEEALSISDRIAVMNAGVVEQIGKPWEIYTAPANRFVAGFIGSTNFFEGTVVSAGADGLGVQVGKVVMKVACSQGTTTEKIAFALRPEAFKLREELSPEAQHTHASLTGTVEKVEYLGGFVKYVLALPGDGRIRILSYDIPPDRLRQKGSPVQVFYDPRRAFVCRN
jgi:iron(III) transport system ATP-binding protein